MAMLDNSPASAGTPAAVVKGEADVASIKLECPLLLSPTTVNLGEESEKLTKCPSNFTSTSVSFSTSSKILPGASGVFCSKFGQVIESSRPITLESSPDSGSSCNTSPRSSQNPFSPSNDLLKSAPPTPSTPSTPSTPQTPLNLKRKEEISTSTPEKTLTPPLCVSDIHQRPSQAFFPFPVTPPRSQIQAGLELRPHDREQTKPSASQSPSTPVSDRPLRHKEAYLTIETSPNSCVRSPMDKEPVDHLLVSEIWKESGKLEDDNLQSLSSFSPRLCFDEIGFPFLQNVMVDDEQVAKSELAKDEGDYMENDFEAKRLYGSQMDSLDDFSLLDSSCSSEDRRLNSDDSDDLKTILDEWPFPLETKETERNVTSPPIVRTQISNTFPRSLIFSSEGLVDNMDSLSWHFGSSQSNGVEVESPTVRRRPGTNRLCSQGSKRFICQQCGKGFTQKGGLTNHARIHTGERPFKCDDCGRKFTQKCNLTRHLRVHTGEKPYQCATCGKRFNRKWGLVVHQRTHNKGPPL